VPVRNRRLTRNHPSSRYCLLLAKGEACACMEVGKTMTKRAKVCCKCIEEVGKLLRPQGYMIDVSFPIGKKADERCVVSTSKITGVRGAVRRHLVASYCPFCGREYDQEKSALRKEKRSR
jgi:hypothetical protein